MKANNTIIEKKWSQNDFNKMGWHDCKVHAIAFNDADFELSFDIDYIIKWIEPKDSENFSFKVAPATLVFKNVWNLKVNLEYDLDIRVEDVHRSNPCQPKNKGMEGVLEYDWGIVLSTGEISFKSVGYNQYIRQAAFITEKQILEINQRGGISFSKD